MRGKETEIRERRPRDGMGKIERGIKKGMSSNEEEAESLLQSKGSRRGWGWISSSVRREAEVMREGGRGRE